MKNADVTWRLFGIYLLIILFMLLAGTSSGQVVATHFNAEWNKQNKAEWVDSLTDCEITYTKCPKKIKRNKVIVLPTIIIFKDGVEMYRFEADLSFKMVATKKELQKYIDELIEDKY
tara:strand:+ start:663 stop:1013 length:351 start_codon:yes stop_codon:yes gene_type:complete